MTAFRWLYFRQWVVMITHASSQVVILDRKESPSSPRRRSSTQMCFRAVLCSKVSIFGTLLVHVSVLPSSLTMTVTAGFPVHLWRGSHSQSAHQATRLGCRCRGWSDDARSVTSVLFTAFKTKEPASNWANTYSNLTVYVYQTSVYLYRAGAFPSIRTSPTPDHLHCHYVGTHMTGALMILEGQDKVARNSTGAIFKFKKK
jgi:hypothetical protein